MSKKKSSAGARGHARNVCACGRTKRITEKTCMMCRVFPEPLSKYRSKRKLTAPQPSERDKL